MALPQICILDCFVNSDNGVVGSRRAVARCGGGSDLFVNQTFTGTTVRLNFASIKSIVREQANNRPAKISRFLEPSI